MGAGSLRNTELSWLWPSITRYDDELPLLFAAALASSKNAKKLFVEA
jgi:hypothetical protein